MKKKKQRNYSLTAKERKQIRRGKDSTETGKTSGLESAEQAMATAQKRSKRTSIIIGVVACIAVVLIVVAMLVPALAYVANPYRKNKDVIARFTLSNGMILEYVIDEKDYDIAATNFIFLAKNGFFDNTVFFDAQNGWLRFGGYESQPTTDTKSSSDYARTFHRINNQTYCENFKVLPGNRFDGWKNKFGYRLRSDSMGTDMNLLNEKGILAFLYSDTATEFQFSYTEQASNQIDRKETSGGTSKYTLSCTMVGHVLNDRTLNNIIAIAGSAKDNSTITSGYAWKPPTPTVYIRKVKVYNLDSSKWRDFDFIEYMREGNHISNWIGQI